MLFRTEFEVTSNTIDVRLHFASHYCIENGTLKLLNTHTDTHTFTLSFDRRRTVGDLRLAVYQVTSSEWDTIPDLLSMFCPSLFLLHFNSTNFSQVGQRDVKEGERLELFGKPRLSVCIGMGVVICVCVFRCRMHGKGTWH